MSIWSSAIAKKRIQSDRVSNWNLNVPGGWKTYEEMSDKIAKKMNTIIEDESLDIEDVKKKTDALQTILKFQAFGKTKPPTGRARKRRQILPEGWKLSSLKVRMK